MKIIKKISLIFIGILLSLILLETGLQITGFTLTAIKKYKNKITKDSNAITILCLGESTTDGQWPPILQKILNEKSKSKKFNVIDEGHAGTNTARITSKIQKNILKFNPDSVIFMMGVNDGGIGYMKHKIKIVNFFILLKKHFMGHFFTDYTKLIPFRENMQKAQDLTNLKKYDKAEKLFRKILTQTNDSFCYSKFLEMYYLSNQFEKLENLVSENFYIIHIGVDVMLKYFLNDKKYTNDQIQKWVDENENRLLINNEIKEYFSRKYNISFNVNKDVKRKKILKPKEFKEVVNKDYIKINNYCLCIETIYNTNNNIKILAMQYPTLSIEKLKEDLKISPYYDKLIFVSNEENFKQALQEHKIEDIFVDMFGGSFGHCTELGNTLIAENVAENILKLYN